MRKIILFFISSILFFNLEAYGNESNPYRQNVEEIFNIGKMLSHDKKFTLFFKSREKAILARGEEFNYISDYPQDLYILDNKTGKINPVITYDWFPQRVKNLSLIYTLPTFPEDYAYYLLNDNETLILISGVKSIRSNFKYNLKNKVLKNFLKIINIKYLFLQY